jgi:hypothetical protein
MAAVTLATIILIAASPLLLLLWRKPKGVNWVQLSNIGQTYGGASAILAALALLGVSVSLLLQARQNRADRVQDARDRQFQFLNLVLEKPNDYAPMLMGVWPAKTGEELRTLLFVNLWTSMLRSMFETKTITETEVRSELQAIYATTYGRTWYDMARSRHISEHATSKAERNFTFMIHDEYRKAVPAGRSIENVAPGIVKEDGNAWWKMLLAAMAVTCAGMLLGSRMRNLKLFREILTKPRRPGSRSR